MNLRPPGPQPGALPDCATPRGLPMITAAEAAGQAPRRPFETGEQSGRRGSNPFLELGRLPCSR